MATSLKLKTKKKWKYSKVKSFCKTNNIGNWRKHISIWYIPAKKHIKCKAWATQPTKDREYSIWWPKWSICVGSSFSNSNKFVLCWLATCDKNFKEIGQELRALACSQTHTQTNRRTNRANNIIQSPLRDLYNNAEYICVFLTIIII